MSADETTGSFLELDGRPAVRFSREYDNPVEQVWALVATPHGLAAWFPSPQVELDLKPGGTIRFSGDPHMPESRGTVRAAEPGRLLAFTWGDDELRFELTELGPDQTRLQLVDLLESAQAAARNAAGWELCLRALDARASGAPAPERQPDAWLPLYRAYQAAGFPSGAPVPGLDE
ncbi:SRPBCC family protein [Streptacidiphilus monticola]|uniref:SRPBCC family protein n=1 Tax=Streptacidiphilus monticola TaxID=2161674 RepID=A0ABW1G5M1_9ACTN